MLVCFSLPHFKGLPLLPHFYLEHPWWPKLEKEAMAASIGMQWSIASLKFKLLNVISDQLMDCNVIIDHYRHIAVHKLDCNYVKKLKFGRNCQIHLLSPT